MWKFTDDGCPILTRYYSLLVSILNACYHNCLEIKVSKSFLNSSRMDSKCIFYTRNEVVIHNTADDMWVIVNGLVFDLTNLFAMRSDTMNDVSSNLWKVPGKITLKSVLESSLLASVRREGSQLGFRRSREVASPNQSKHRTRSCVPTGIWKGRREFWGFLERSKQHGRKGHVSRTTRSNHQLFDPKKCLHGRMRRRHDCGDSAEIFSAVQRQCWQIYLAQDVFTRSKHRAPLRR